MPQGVPKQEIDKLPGSRPVVAEGGDGNGDIANPGNLALLQGDGLNPLRIPVLKNAPADDRVHRFERDGGGGLLAAFRVVHEIPFEGSLLGCGKLFLNGFYRIKPDTDSFRIGNGNPDARSGKIAEVKNPFWVSFLHVYGLDKVNHLLFGFSNDRPFFLCDLHEIR